MLRFGNPVRTVHVDATPASAFVVTSTVPSPAPVYTTFELVGDTAIVLMVDLPAVRSGEIDVHVVA